MDEKIAKTSIKDRPSGRFFVGYKKKQNKGKKNIMNYTNIEIINFIRNRVLYMYPHISENYQNDVNQVFKALTDMDIERIVKKIEDKFYVSFDESVYASTGTFDMFCNKICSIMNPGQNVSPVILFTKKTISGYIR